MTSTTSKFDRWWNNWTPWIFMAYCAFILCLVGCDATQPAPTTERHHGFPAQPREATTSTQAEPQEQPKSPPTGNTAPAEKEPEREPPYFGSTYFNETLTSVYFYPGESKDDVAMTHLKFGYREDLLYLCGDQRKNFEPGTKYHLVVTFEPNAPCITNWKIK